MSKSVWRAPAVLIPLGTAALLLPPADRLLPEWVSAALLVFAVRVLDGAAGRAFGRPDPAFPPEAQAWAAPFSVRILSLLSAPGTPDLFVASALWAAYSAAACSAEAAAARRGRTGFAAFAAALGSLAAFTALAGPFAGAAGAGLAAVGLIYAARRRIPR